MGDDARKHNQMAAYLNNSRCCAELYFIQFPLHFTRIEYGFFSVSTEIEINNTQLLSFRSTTGNQTDGKVISNGIAHGVPIATRGFVIDSASSSFKLFDFERRLPKANDVLIRIHYCGVCHSDIHQAKNEWHNSKYPMVPGHEITGVVEQVGSSVRNFRAGDHVGVGCMVDSCLHCNP
jgi:hypothetical protein